VPLLKFINNDEYSLYQSASGVVQILNSQRNFQVEEEITLTLPFDYMVLSPSPIHPKVAFVNDYRETSISKILCRVRISMYPELGVHILDKEFENSHQIDLKWSPDCNYDLNPRQLIIDTN